VSLQIGVHKIKHHVRPGGLAAQSAGACIVASAGIVKAMLVRVARACFFIMAKGIVIN
jgi:hypothetical protein